MSNAQKSGNQEFDPTLGGADPSATAQATATPADNVNPVVPLATSQRRAQQQGGSRVVPRHIAEMERASLSSSPTLRDAPLAGVGLSEEGRLVKAALDKEPKFAFHVPLEPGEKAGVAYRSVTINGYRCEVRKGVQVMLPKSIYQLLMDAYRIEVETLDYNPYNLDQQPGDVRAALR